MEAELSTCMSLENIYKFLQLQVAQVHREHELIPCGTLPKSMTWAIPLSDVVEHTLQPRMLQVR